MTLQTLVKHGYEVVFETSRMKAYQLDDTMIVVWKNGSYNVYELG